MSGELIQAIVDGLISGAIIGGVWSAVAVLLKIERKLS